MFETISAKISNLIKKITGQGIITEKNIENILHDIKMAFLEADVNYKVTKEFIEKVKQKALGKNVLNSLTSEQQFVKIIHDELVSFLGNKFNGISKEKPVTILLAGLQGSGKTTTSAKLAFYIKNEKIAEKILLVSLDTKRAAAKEQLKILADKNNFLFYTENNDDSLQIAENAYRFGLDKLCDAMIFDTAGTLHINQELLSELKKLKEKIKFSEIFLVADAMLGQEAVNIAKNFNEMLGLTGIILTKTDGDAKGGAALSMKYVTSVPVKFIGTGEKIDKLDIFHPDRIASAILGMGDIVSLVEKVEKTISEEERKKQFEKLKKASFTFDDFLIQLKQLQNIGPLQDLIKMLPGGYNLPNINIDEKDIKHIEAIILSMTKKERLMPEIINESRKSRIARGSGTSYEKVNKLLKQFSQMKKFLKKSSGKNFNPFKNFYF